MFCPKCGKDARNQAAFCNHCGAAMPQIAPSQVAAPAAVPVSSAAPTVSAAPDVPKRIRKPAKKNPATKKRIIAVSVVAGVLVIGSCVGIGIYRNQTAAQRQMFDYLKRGKYSQAAEYYQKHSDEIKTEKLLPALEAAIADIYDDFLDEHHSYHECTEMLDTFSIYTLEGIGGLVTETDQKLQALSDSRSAYLQAEQAEASKNYAKAIEQYRQVISDDPQYDAAQKQIEACRGSYTKDVLERAENYQNNHAYGDALNILKEAAAILTDDAQISAALDTCVSEYQALLFERAANYAKDGDYELAADFLMGYVDVFPNKDDLQKKADEYLDQLMDSLLKDANNYIKKGDYHSAILAIQNVKEDYPDSNRVQELEQSAMSAYLKQQLPLIDAAVNAADYLRAYTICKNALEIMPDENELLTRMETIDAKRPILLNELPISQSSRFYRMDKKGEICYDTIGNEYTYGNLYYANAYGDRSSYADIYLGSQYSSLSGVIAVDDDSDNTSGKVLIYGDGTLLYSGSYSRTTVPQKINLDVSGVSWLKIALSENYWDDLVILFSDFAFTKLGS